MEDRRLKTGRTGSIYRPAWSFKGPTTAFLEDLIKDAERPVVHICSGASRLGDIKVDLYHPNVTVRADVHNLPFKAVSTILTDPPWGWPLGTRTVFWTEIVKALKIGGKAYLYAPWLPISSKIMRLDRAWIRALRGYGFPRAPVIVSEWTKLREYRPSERKWLNDEMARKRRERAGR